MHGTQTIALKPGMVVHIRKASAFDQGAGSELTLLDFTQPPFKPDQMEWVNKPASREATKTDQRAHLYRHPAQEAAVAVKVFVSSPTPTVSLSFDPYCHHITHWLYQSLPTSIHYRHCHLEEAKR